MSVLTLSACGQKGPPLAPIVYLPKPVSEVIVKRVENEVVLQFTLPTTNTDNSGPANLRRVEVYAHTGPLPAPADFLKYGSLVASIDVKQPKTPEELKAEQQRAEAQGAESKDPAAPQTVADTPTPAPRAADPQAGLIEQGWTTSVRETLTPKHMEIGPMPPTRPLAPVTEPAVVVERIETPGTVNFELAPQRYYTIVGVSTSRSRRGPFAGPIQVALLEPLSPPEKVDVEYSAETINLMWPGQPEDVVPAVPAAGGPAASVPAQGATPGATSAPAGPQAAQPDAAAAAPPAAPPPPVAPPLDRETEGTVRMFADTETDQTVDVLPAVATPAPGAKPKPVPAAAAPPVPRPRFGYNVYELGAAGATTRAAETAPGAMPAPAANVAPLTPLNATLLTTPGFADPRVEFGLERCYVVRRVEMAGAIPVESAPSPPVCVTPADTFPPAAPKSLAHIAAGNGVSLLWEANAETDLGGYLVLRGEAPGDTLSPLTPAPITDTSFLDSTVRRGRTYFYEVVAVDRSTPPNQSAPSNRVEETIR